MQTVSLRSSEIYFFSRNNLSELYRGIRGCRGRVLQIYQQELAFFEYSERTLTKAILYCSDKECSSESTRECSYWMKE